MHRLCSRRSGHEDPPTRHPEHQAGEPTQQERAGGEKHSATELRDGETRAPPADRLQTRQVHTHAQHAVKMKLGVNFHSRFGETVSSFFCGVVGGVLVQMMHSKKNLCWSLVSNIKWV